jgi:hypothetical protein
LIGRGLAFGASGEIDLSGDSSASTATGTGSSGISFAFPVYPGPGGAGCPGGLLVLLDGSGVSVPDLGGKFTATCGSVPIDGTPLPQRGPAGFGEMKNAGWTAPGSGYRDESVISGIDMSNVAYRIQYIPGEETAQEDNERPPSPTGLRLFKQFNDRILTWFTPPQALYDTVEVYASSVNDRTTAVLLGEVRGSVFTYTPTDRGTLYYWIRAQKGPNFSEWNPVSSTGGLSNDANLPDVHRIFPDPEFVLGTDQFWYITEGGHSLEILDSGGVAGGLARIILDSGSTDDAELYAARVPPMQATTGQAIEMTVRWRRTTAISHNTIAIVMVVRLAADPANDTPSVAATLLSAAGTDREDDLGSFTVNEWQEIRGVFRLQNNPKSSAQLPYLRCGVVVTPNGSGRTGTIEIDRVDAIFGVVI